MSLLEPINGTLKSGILAGAPRCSHTPTNARINVRRKIKMFGQVIGKLEAQLTRNWSVNVEGEFRGRTDVYGVAGRVGATYTFN